MLPTYGIGFDFGNSHATAALYAPGSDTPTLLTVPSVSAPGSVRDYVAMNSAAGQSSMDLNPYDHMQPGDYTIAYDGQPERFVGNLALRQSRRPSSGRGDIGRYSSPRALELLLVLAGTLIPEEHFDILVVAGLPVETYRSVETQGKMKKALNGMHSFTLNGHARTAKVKVGKILMEGAGAALALGIPSQSTYGIIDVGEFTTDLYVTRGLETIAYMCGGAEIGIANAGDRLDTLFAREYGRHLSQKERMSVLRAYLSPTRPESYPSLHAEETPVDPLRLDTWVHQALRETGRDVKEFVASSWRTGSQGLVAADFAHVQVIGGGAYYMVDDVREIIRKAVRSVDPENDNARGYGWYANQLVSIRSTNASQSA